MTRIFLLCGLLLTGCGSDTTSSGPDDRLACLTCLVTGGTWQPEAEECTDDCDIQDISCYTDSCPGECNDRTCECLSQDTCEAAGCTWNSEGEAMWCN